MLRSEAHTTIAYDASRLFLGPLSATPRGIDRVDLSFARHFFETWSGPCLALLPTPWGVRLYDRGLMLKGLDRLEAIWRESGGDNGAGTLAAVLQRVRSGNPAAPLDRSRGRTAQTLRAVMRQGRLLATTGVPLGRSTVRSLAANATFISIGQLSLTAPFLFRWLDRRPDVRPVFMLHDVIPLEAPHFVAASARDAHDRAVELAGRRAWRILTPSRTAATRVRAELSRRGRRNPPVAGFPLPVPKPFLCKMPDPADVEPPFFVVCGSIDRRKNHRLLVDVWGRLLERGPGQVPKLVVVGLPGWGSGEILDAMAATPALRAHIIRVEGLPTPALRDLLCRARALLMPSMAEGFGLPIVETLTLKKPVIASDLPAHLEAGGSAPLYLRVDDVAGWTAAVEDFTRGGPLHREHLARAQTFAPLTEPAYFASLNGFLFDENYVPERESAT